MSRFRLVITGLFAVLAASSSGCSDDECTCGPAGGSGTGGVGGLGGVSGMGGQAGGMGGLGGSGTLPEYGATPSLTFASVKTFRFEWRDECDATHYRLLEDPDGLSGFRVVGPSIERRVERIDHVVPLYARLNAQYILQTCNAAGCVDSDPISVGDGFDASIGHFQASYTRNDENGEGDRFGTSVSVSAAGDRLAIGAPAEDSGLVGVEDSVGAVWVFRRDGATWHEEAYLKASNAEEDDGFGWVSLDAAGEVLVVGAGGESSGASGVGGDQADNSAPRAGAAYVFRRVGTAWTQEAYLKPSNPGAGDEFGWAAVAVSSDGSTIAVPALGESSRATGVDGDETDNSAPDAGAVYVFRREGSAWTQEAYLKASNTDSHDHFGSSLSFSADGTTLAVAASEEDSWATGVNGDEIDNSEIDSGAVYVFRRNGSTWAQEAYLKASNTDADDRFGRLSLNANGDTLAVGAPYEDGDTRGVNGDQGSNLVTDSGAVYLFRRIDGTWTPGEYLKASNAESGDLFGSSVSLSADGGLLAVGAMFEASGATGIEADQDDNSVSLAGAAYLFRQTDSTWTQQVYVKPTQPSVGGHFGWAVELSGDGDTLVVAADGEYGSWDDEGAVYLY